MLDALDRAREAERRLLADASHELRTPVTSLRGNAAFARRHGADAELLAELEADAERLARLVDDLLALEREAGAERPDAEVDLEAVIDAVVAAPDRALDESPLLDALAAADPLAAGPAPRVVVTATAPLAVRGQAGPLERALRNLVENACVHGPAGGEVRVALARRGDEAVLSVTDDGPGIPPAQAAAAPRRFWRGPDATAGGRPGSGLGLAIVAATAARHGGRLEIDGATVAIVLPLVRELSRPARTLVP
jgi:signal transduction histidine kinase